MRNLEINEVALIVGGNSDSDTAQIIQNATLAVQVCGEGNVKEVTKDGFKCFDDKTPES